MLLIVLRKLWRILVIVNNTSLDIFSIQNYIRVCASKADLDVVFDNVEAPQTNGRTIRLPHLNDHVTQEDIIRLTSYVNHEAAHHAYQTDYELAAKYGLGQLESELGLLWGIFEDTRVDRHDYKEWYGDATNMEAYYDLTSDKTANIIYSLYDNLNKQEALPPDQVPSEEKLDRDQIDRLAATLCMDNIVRSEWMGTPSNYTKDMIRFLSPEAEKYVEAFVEGGYADKINSTGKSLKGSAEVKDVAGQVYKEIFHMDPEEEFDRMQNEAGDEKDEGGEEGEGEASAQEGKGEGQSGELSQAVKELISDWDPFQKEIEEGTPPPNGLHLNYPEQDDYWKVFRIADAKDLKIMDFESGKGQNISIPTPEEARRDYGYSSIQKSVTVAGSGNTGAVLANKVRRLLQIRAKSKYQHGLKRGKLDSRNVYRVTMRDAPGFNERTFKKKEVNDTLDVAVTLLVDFSGSMHGQKIATAIHSSLLLAEAISQSLRIPLEILGFTDFNRSSCLSVFKTFDRPVSLDMLQERMLAGTVHMSGNADGEAIAWANSRLAPRTEKRRIMIVLSDGSPACGRGGNIDKFTKKVIEGIETRKQQEIVGIGIMDTNVQRLYKSNYVIHRVDQLEEALLHVIEKKLL